MKKEFKLIWDLAEPYLKKGRRKDFVLHTKQVLRAMKLLLKKESGNERLLIPAAILHDTGWSNVPLHMQKSDDKKEKIKALELHLSESVPIIKKILEAVGFSKCEIETITDIVLAHKFSNPKSHDKRLLIDADTLAEAFKDQFYDDVKSYNCSAEENYNWRVKNKFYTKTAEVIFAKEIKKRKEEIKK